MSVDYFFETKRLLFRQWRESDLVQFAKMNADLEVMEYFPSTLTTAESAEVIGRFQKEINEKGHGPWVAELKSTGAFTGFIGLHEATFESEFTPCVEIGWRLDKPYWGQGLATEGALASLDYGFSQVGLKEIYSFTSLLNVRSEKVMKKIGMNKIGEFNHPKVPADSPLLRHSLYLVNNNEFQLLKSIPTGKSLPFG